MHTSRIFAAVAGLAVACLVVASCGTNPDDLPPGGEGGGDGTVTRDGSSRDYVVDEAASRLLIRVPKTDGGGCAFTHSHVLEATAPAYSFDVDVDTPGETRISATVAASNLEADDPNHRAEFPETADETLSDNQRSQILNSALQALRAEDHPELVFSGEGPTSMDGDGSVDVESSFAGETSTSTLTFTASWDGDELTIEGSAPIDRTPHDLDITVLESCVDPTMILELRLVLVPAAATPA